jgi:heptosyltransferase I
MLSAVGDTVHVLPVVSALKRQWPETQITWVIHPLPHSLVAGHGAVDRFIVFPRPRASRAATAYLALARELRHTRYDLCLSLQVSAKAGVIQRLSGARLRIGFDWRRTRDLNWFANNVHIPPATDAHVQDQYLEFLRFLKVETDPVTWGLTLTGEERAARDAFFGPLGGPAVGLVLGATDPRRNWHAEGYARVIDEIGRRHGLPCVLLGGPSEEEARMAAGILSRSRGPVPPIDARGDGLRRMLWLLEGSALVVSPDTGPLHMARAVGTPVVGLYGRTNPRRAGPYRAWRDLLVDGYADHPGEAYDASRSYRNGMGRITPDQVLEKVVVALERYVGTTAGGRGSTPTSDRGATP